MFRRRKSNLDPEFRMRVQNDARGLAHPDTEIVVESGHIVIKFMGRAVESIPC